MDWNLSFDLQLGGTLLNPSDLSNHDRLSLIAQRKPAKRCALIKRLERHSLRKRYDGNRTILRPQKRRRHPRPLSGFAVDFVQQRLDLAQHRHIVAVEHTLI